jgi:hypothetical protein
MPDVVVTIPVLIVLVMLAAFVIRRLTPVERTYAWVSFVAHQVAAVAMIAVTRDYYEGGDMLAYQLFGTLYAARLRDNLLETAPALLDLVLQRSDAAHLPGALMGSSTGSIQGLSAFMMFLLADSLYAVCAVIACASFLSKLAVYQVAKREFPAASPRWLLVACLLIPSAVFWSSGLLKEPLAVIGLSMLVRGGYQLTLRARSVRSLIWIAAGGLLVGLLKPYLLPPCGLGAGAFLLLRGLRRRAERDLLLPTRYVIAGAAVAIIAIFVTGATAPYLSPDNLADEAMNMRATGARIEGGSNFDLGSAQSASIIGQLSLAPLALLTVLFRPAIFEATNVLMFLNSLEMSVVVVLLATALVRRGAAGTLQELMRAPALVFCAVFVFTLAIGVGLTTTNLGTLSRYRMPLMSFFGILLVVLSTPVAVRSPVRRDPAIMPPLGPRQL